MLRTRSTTQLQTGISSRMMPKNLDPPTCSSCARGCSGQKEKYINYRCLSRTTSNSNFLFPSLNSLRSIYFPTVHAQGRSESEGLEKTTDKSRNSPIHVGSNVEIITQRESLFDQLQAILSKAFDGKKKSPELEETSVESCDAPIVLKSEVEECLKNERGMDRLRAMFTKEKADEFSPELAFVGQTAGNCGVIAFLLTSFFGGPPAQEKHLMKTKHTVYETKFLALRQFNDRIVLGTLKFGLYWAIKCSFFAGIFLLTSQTISVYRNKTTVGEYVAAGSLTCGLLRFGVGLRGMFAGSVIGVAFGVVSGTAICSMMYLMNSTQQERHFYSIGERLRNQRLFRKDDEMSKLPEEIPASA